MAANWPSGAPADCRPAEPSLPLAQSPPAERYGTVVLERHRKEDGRALLLYRHAEGERA